MADDKKLTTEPEVEKKKATETVHVPESDAKESKVASTPEAPARTADAPEAVEDGKTTETEKLAKPQTHYLAGAAVCPGAAFGRAQILNEGDLEIPHFSIDKTQTRAEFTRLRAAIHTVDKELEELQQETSEDIDAPSEALAFIELHRQILNDEALISETQGIIREKLINAEWALSYRLEEVRRSFEEIDDEYLSERVVDIAQVFERVQRVLSGRRRPSDSLSKSMSETAVILVARDFSPTDILILKRRRDISVAGLIFEFGSSTSHSSILARSLEIPTLVNVQNACELIRADDVLLMDADKGTVIVNPENDITSEVFERIKKLNAVRARQKKLKTTACVTVDGTQISLFANIALPEDAREAVQNGADGIGLFRSEFLFMNRPSFPSEDEQYENYLRVVRTMRGKPVTIRTMDLGGDKLPSDEALESVGIEPDSGTVNPVLGRRAIRFSLRHTELFLTQLRAILRAGASGNVRIMIPMLSHITQIEAVRLHIQRAQEQLKERGVKYAGNVALGGMIEVPAIALSLPFFMRHLDFASIGTNDLIQYLIAVDRQDPRVSFLYDPLHPAVISTIHSCITASNRMGKEISVCGEVAADPIFAIVLLGLGLRRYSMESGRIPAIKERLLSTKTSEAAALVRRIRRAHATEQIRKLLLDYCAKENIDLSSSGSSLSLRAAAFAGKPAH